MTDAGARPTQSVLLTDLYQLTMVTAYQELGMDREAVFEFFVRTMPSSRGFLLAAGLQQVVEYLEGLHFSDEEVAWLGATGRFTPAALDRLGRLRFTGDVDAMPEGTVFFASEPILRVTAPLPEAQLVESRIVNLLNFQTMIASKAARCRIAAGPRRLVDFGMRRAHGAEAALLAARACYLAGFEATATVEAGRAFGIPLSGTMAHSFVQAHADEATAFRHFAQVHPRGLTLLIDTYDTLRAAQLVVDLHRGGMRIDAVRLDSGDLAALARDVRAILDAGGCRDMKIVVSGNIDEFEIARLLAAAAPIDVFGVGTQLDTSADAPSLDCVYKLQEYDGRPRRKRSPGKATWPGRKQVMREFDADGRIHADVIVPAGRPAAGRSLLAPVMRAGGRVGTLPDLAAARECARQALASIPEVSARVAAPVVLEAQVARELRALAERVDRDFP
jgi:nicotinate phosphoribosyltransferase